MLRFKKSCYLIVLFYNIWKCFLALFCTWGPVIHTVCRSSPNNWWQWNQRQEKVYEEIKSCAHSVTQQALGTQRSEVELNNKGQNYYVADKARDIGSGQILSGYFKEFRI